MEEVTSVLQTGHLVAKLSILLMIMLPLIIDTNAKKTFFQVRIVDRNSLCFNSFYIFLNTPDCTATGTKVSRGNWSTNTWNGHLCDRCRFGDASYSRNTTNYLILIWEVFFFIPRLGCHQKATASPLQGVVTGQKVKNKNLIHTHIYTSQPLRHTY